MTNGERPAGIPVRHTVPTELPGVSFLLTDDGSWSLRDERLEETYHSGCGAASETWHVYLLNSGLMSRWQSGRKVRLLEVGFGTGMGWLMSTTAAHLLGGSLEYLGLEKRPLPMSLIQRCTEVPWQRLAGLSETWDRWKGQADRLRAELLEVAWSPDGVPDGTWIELPHGSESGCSRLWIGDANDWVPKEERWDIVFLDAFSPASNPELWEERFLRNLVDQIAEDGVLVTYCVNRKIRDCMGQVGLRVERLPGPPGGKREVLRATRAVE
ncbi:MAG: tRNA (5-methylaminomethyl-2-thiouridine)(34)-methyltransferase MnmD [Pirellulaceae bacterium]|jgi:tRNA U34 5-methylaminomethyl-2-thiouridine-forming methyltransferase MnmC